MFARKPASEPPSNLFQERLKRLVGEARDRPIMVPADMLAAAEQEDDVLPLLVELRTAAKRGAELTVAHRLGPEFSRYLSEFYKLPAERQPPVLEALVESRRREQGGDLAGAIEACETGLRLVPNYLPLLDRVARLEGARGDRASAERCYARLLNELDRLGFETNALDICRRAAELEVEDAELLEACASRLEQSGEQVLAARCWARRAQQRMAADQPAEALRDLDRALSLQPAEASFFLELAAVYERLGEVDRAALAYEQVAALGSDDAEALGRLLLIRARVSRPDELLLGRLMDLLQVQPEARQSMLARCGQAIEASPYNPHLCYMHGVLLAQAGQLEEGAGALRIAVDRYSVQSDRASELEARLALQQLVPAEEDNRRRIAELHFERGEVHLAMQVLAGLARVARSTTAG